MTLNNLLFSLISSEISEGIAQTKYDKKPDEETLKKLYKTAKAHDVAHIVCEALEKQGFLDDGEISGKFRKKKLVAMYRTEQIVYDYASICSCLEENGVDFLPLKGSVIRDLYPEKWMRTSCDIDILVKREDCERAGRLLCEKLSFKRKDGQTLHDFQLLSPTGVLLELHYTLIEEDCLPKISPFLENVWEKACLCDGFKHKYELSPEVFMLYNTAHMAKHILRGGCGIKSFIDLYILEKKLDFNRQKLNELLEKSSLLTFHNGAQKLCGVWFYGEEYDETSIGLEKYVLAGGVYGTASNGAAISAGKGESRTKAFLNNMFLSYDALCVVYPKLKEKKILYPFYQIKRWFRVFNKEKRKKITSLTGIRNAVSDKERQNAKKLLEKLEIE
ncbi:MAG: nucleotidyltransferase family protein [Clostridia bacterium]|nr:nucleotidyltransferase family protein [Clostridia bacterium]